jgi:hypothetical protein
MKERYAIKKDVKSKSKKNKKLKKPTKNII